MAIEEMRKDGEDPLILDAGDMFFSTVNINKNNLKAEKYRSETMLSAYEKIGCDGLNVGKYELLAGLGYLTEMNNKFTEIDFISANIRRRDSKELIFLPYKIIKKRNLNIGVIGLTNMVPDTMKSIIVDDYVKTGNEYISEIKNKVDIIVMLINAERKIQSTMAKNFKDADFIFTSGSTQKTSPSVSQNSGGPFLYSNGKQGKFLTIVDLEMNDDFSPIIDISPHEQKIKQVSNRIKRLQKKDPKKKLEEIYAGQENILNMIKRYNEDLGKAEAALKKSINKIKYSSLALNKRVKDDPEMLAMVDNAIEMCSSLNLNPPKKEHNHSHSSKKNSKKNKRSKFSKPPKANIRP